MGHQFGVLAEGKINDGMVTIESDGIICHPMEDRSCATVSLVDKGRSNSCYTIQSDAVVCQMNVMERMFSVVGTEHVYSLYAWSAFGCM